MDQPRSNAHKAIALIGTLAFGLALVLGMTWLLASGEATGSPIRAIDQGASAGQAATGPAALPVAAQHEAGVTHVSLPSSAGATGPHQAAARRTGGPGLPTAHTTDAIAAARAATLSPGQPPALQATEPGQPEGAFLAHFPDTSLGGASMAGGMASSADPVASLGGVSALAAPPVPGNGDTVLSLGSKRVWGVVGAGETITVTVNGTQMGASRADAVGFFWTPLYVPEGTRPALVAGDVVTIYVEGSPRHEVTLRAVSAALDIVADEIEGTITSLPNTELTLYALDDVVPEPTMTTFSTTVTTSVTGAFSSDFGGEWPFVGWDHVVVAYVDDGLQVQAPVYATESLMVRPAPWNWVFGRVAPGEAITITVYESDGTTQKAQAQLTAGADGFYFHVSSAGMLEDDIVTLTRADTSTLSRTIDPLTARIYTDSDRITGKAEPGAEVMARLEHNLTADGTVVVNLSTVADGAGDYTIDFTGVADLLPGDNIPIFVDDAEGDNLNIRTIAPVVAVNQVGDRVAGYVPGPSGHLAAGRNVTLTLYSAAQDQLLTFTSETGDDGWFYFDKQALGLPDIAPGDTVTVEITGFAWKGVVNVAMMTTTPDMVNDQITGEVTPPSTRVEVWGRQWNGWTGTPLFPVGETFEVTATADSTFTVAPAGYDIRNATDYQVRHRTEDGQVEALTGNTDFVRAWAMYNYTVVSFAPPRTPYTLTLRAGDGTYKGQLTGVSNEPTGMDHRGWGEVDAQLVAGDTIQAQSATGFDQTLTVVPLDVFPDERSDVIRGYGPPNTLVNLNIEDASYGFVPTGPDGVFAVAMDQLQVTSGDDLAAGQWVRLCTADADGNHVCTGASTPTVILRTSMDGQNDVFGDSAIPGNEILITVTHPVTGVIATATTSAGTGWSGPRSFYAPLDRGILTPGVTVAVDFGNGIVETVDLVEITGEADIDSDRITGTAPANSIIRVVARDQWGTEVSLDSVPVDSGGAYEADFSTISWDIQAGHSFSVYLPLERGHQIEYAFWLPHVELRIEKEQTPGIAVPGGTYLYKIRTWNDGDGDAENVVITDTLPADTSYLADTSGVSVIDGGNVITWELGTLPAYSYDEFFVALSIDADAPVDTSLGENCVGIATTSLGDTNPGDDRRCTGGPWITNEARPLGVGVNKGPNPGDPRPGQEFAYEIDYWNESNAASGPVWLTDTLPAGTTFVRWEEQWGWEALWTEVVTDTGTFALYAPAGFPGDLGGHIRLTLRLDESAEIGTQLSNTVVITTTQDENPDNNEHLNTEAQVSGERPDLRVDKSLHQGVLAPDGWANYFVWYGNQGNVAVPVRITETVPAGMVFEYAHWGGGQPGENEPLPDPVINDGTQVVWELGELPVNGNRWFHVQMSFDATLEAGDTVTNCVTIGSGGEESSPEDNTSCASILLNASGANLRVTKESWWNGDGNLGYRVHFYNIGNEVAENVWITDTLPISTNWDRWFNYNFGWDRLIQAPDGGNPPADDVLGWQLTRLEPGDYGQIEFNASLEEPGTPMRWYTNTVTIDSAASDVVPDDNSYQAVDFSGGEVWSVDVDVYRTTMWASAPRGPITVTTKDGTREYGGDFRDDQVGTGFLPGDVVTVTAGAGDYPVILTIPDPYIAYASSITKTVWGQIDHLDHEEVEVDLWGFPTVRTATDGDGHFSVEYGTMPRGATGDVNYRTEIAYADVGFHGRFQSPDLMLNVNYDHDWVNGNYEPGHTIWITVTESDHSTVRGTTELVTGPVPDWGGQSGFQTYGDSWNGGQLDIQPGDWVDAAVDNGYTSTVQVGTIAGLLDVDADQITGTVSAAWWSSEVDVTCHPWGSPSGAPSKNDRVSPDGSDPFACSWDPLTEWDIEPGQDLGVSYTEPDGDQVFAVFRGPAPQLRVEKWLDGEGVSQGGGAVFTVQYRNEGDADAEGVTITDTLQGMTYITDTSGFAHTGAAGEVVWNVGTVAPGDWIQFSVYATVDASDRVTNTVAIATTNPYDMGDDGMKHGEWSGDVQTNDTYLNIGKGAWTDDPAAGEDVVFQINACNNGGTASSQVTITDTLHLSMTLSTWRADSPGWVELPSDPGEFVVTKASIAGHRCENIYVRVTIDGDAWPGMPLWNEAAIYAANDLSGDDNTTRWEGQVGEPHTNLQIGKSWNSGTLVAGGELRYGVHYQNTGNIPVGPFQITDTLPVNTTFVEAHTYNGAPVTPSVTGDGFVVWDFPGLDNGYSGDFEVVLAVDGDAGPGTLLVNTVEVTELPGEDAYDDNVASVTETLFDHGPNLRVRKSGSWDDWGEGTRRASYWLNVENVGDVTVEAVEIIDTYPAGMHLDGGIGINTWEWADWRDNGDHFTATLQRLEPGWAVGLNFGLIVDQDPLPSGLIFTNTAQVMLIPEDKYPDDNVATAVLTTGPNLWVRKELTAGSLLPGDLVTYTLTFGNAIDGRLWWWALEGNAVLTDTLPTGLEFVSAQQHWCGPAGEWCENTPAEPVAGTLVWNLWRLNPGESNEIIVTARITDTATGLDSFINGVEIGSTEPERDAEVDTSDNADSVAFDVPLPYFEVSKAYQSSRVAGTPVTYTVTVTNSGHAAGTSVVLGDKFPAGFTYTDGDGTPGSTSVQWTFATLAAAGGVETGWFSGLLPCATGPFTNNDYAVLSSTEGVTSALGSPVSLTVIAPTVAASFSHSTPAVISTTVAFTDTSTTNGSAISTWMWTFGDGVTSTLRNPSHVFDAEGAVTVTLTVTDTCGFGDTAMTTFEVQPEGYTVFLPLVIRQ